LANATAYKMKKNAEETLEFIIDAHGAGEFNDFESQRSGFDLIGNGNQTDDIEVKMRLEAL